MQVYFPLSLMLFFSSTILAQGPGSPPQERFTPGDTTGRSGMIVADSLRVRSEFAILCQRLKLDSAQAEYVKNVLARRDRLLGAQRREPARDGAAAGLRARKVMAEADRDIGKKLDPEQLKEYRKLLKERAKTMPKKAKGERGGKPPHGVPGGPGNPGSGPGGLGEW